jgi:hypothetical protein
MKENYRLFRKDALSWLISQPQKQLENDFSSCIDLKNCILEERVPVFFRRLIHFDEICSTWIRNRLHHKVPLPHLASLTVAEYRDYQIPCILQHLVCQEQIQLFEEGLNICEEHERKKKEDFKELTDWIETSHIKISEEQLQKTAREKLPAGVNATATKKYVDWISKDFKKKQTVFNSFGRKFWLQQKENFKLWQTLWQEPLHFGIETPEILRVPADLRAAILRAKLNGALMTFPQSGLYVGHWSFQAEQRAEDWNLGLFTLIPRPCHDFLVVWKGNLSMAQETKNEKKDLPKENLFVSSRKNRYRQSFPHQGSQFFIDVCDEEGKERGFSMQEEWIAQYGNEPPAHSVSNSYTSLSAPLPNIYHIRTSSLSTSERKGLPTVKLFCSTELTENEEILYRYFPTEYQDSSSTTSSTSSVSPRDKVKTNYAVGPEFQETRRRLHFFLPGATLRKWIQDPSHQEKLAKFLQVRLYQHYIDDYFWRSFSAPSPFSHLSVP